MPNSRPVVRIIRLGAGNGQSRAKGLIFSCANYTILIIIITGMSINIIIFTQSVISIFIIIIIVIIIIMSIIITIDFSTCWL